MSVELVLLGSLEENSGTGGSGAGGGACLGVIGLNN